MQPRPAATLALLRDAREGLEVLMLQRTHKAVFMPGFYVFPGGAVDHADSDPALMPHLDGLDEDAANTLLNLEAGGLGYLVAAIRECFEEAGVLLARPGDADWPEPHHPVLADDRDAVMNGELDWLTLCRRHDLRVPLESLGYFDHWVTPPGPPRRFDTRFFVAEAPPFQQPRHDGQETIDHCWVNPRLALEYHGGGERQFATPTLSVLRRLGQFDSVTAVMEYASVHRPRRMAPLSEEDAAERFASP
ncbi:hypothetical protein SAMN05877962_105162 [Alloalcanivorax xenomutans]|uniref:NUDIX hydrolase n=1 Tax=Alloalcanivorax xenomutans TaxID=1094342 RepID=UPI000BD12686|nr:NUDIX domain-containing protein [Alloalcanivorax xenomutans]SOC02906.1 hypothetical protein SAMN05877962_105162 [Alloalcanivorax xenomutans]